MNLRDIPLERVPLVLINTAIPCLLLWADPWGASTSLEHAIDRWVAVASQFFYASKAQDRLAVALIDEGTLNVFGTQWPLSYSDVANIGSRIACSRAIAIFFDFTAISLKNVEGTSDLLRMAGAPEADTDAKPFRCRDGGVQPQIPVYFADIPTILTPPSSPQSELKKRRQTFLIQTKTHENIYPSGPVEFMDNPPTTDEITPAFGLFRLFCGQPKQGSKGVPGWCPEAPVDYTAPIFLSWNGNPTVAQRDVSDAPECDREVKDAFGKIFAGIQLLFKPKHRRCPPFLTLTGEDLYRDSSYITGHDVDPASLLAGKIVLVGVSLVGVQDEVISPVHGPLQGVFTHAVALDNLITYGGRHYTVPQEMIRWTFIFVVLLAINGTLATFFLASSSRGRKSRKNANPLTGRKTRAGASENQIDNMRVSKYFGIVLVLIWVALTGIVVWYMRWPLSLLVIIAILVLGFDWLELICHRVGIDLSNIPGRVSSNERKH